MTDAGGRGSGQGSIVDRPAARLRRDGRLWTEEVARVLEGTSAFEHAAARSAVLRVLTSLAADATESPATRRDARALLGAFTVAEILQASPQEPDRSRSLIKQIISHLDRQRESDERIRSSNPVIHAARLPTAA
jgi:hypothetical protein